MRSGRIVGLALLLTLTTAHVLANGLSPVYVDKDAAGPTHDGSAWSNAFLTVQEGIDAAQSNGTVWVAAGTYNESITLKHGVAVLGGFAGTETLLDERNWNVNVTILNGGKTGSVVVCPTNALPDTSLDGFTILNGIGTIHDGDRYGGGIFCEESSPSILNNVIAMNTCEEEGGAIYCPYGSPVISNNTITANTAGSGGGAISCSGSPLIVNNTIFRNAAGTSGGGVFCYYGSPSILNNTFVRNDAAQEGGGIHCFASAAPLVVNNIIALGSSGFRKETGTTPVLSNNCVYGNAAYNYSGTAAGDGDISEDPQLTDARGGDLHLGPASPCIDAGDDSVVQAGGVDGDGQARINNVVDIGADEYYANTVRRVSPTGDDGNDGSTWSNAFLTIQAAIDASAALDEIWVEAGAYDEALALSREVRLYGGFTGTETARTERDWVANPAVIEADDAVSVVSVAAGATPATRVDGFTIRNGNALLGGGILCVAASPSIANNLITANAADGANSAGGGIYCSDASRAAILDNTLTGNTAEEGAGIACYAGAYPWIEGNNIATNSAEGGDGDGGGIFCYSASPVITNNLVARNSAAGNFSAYGGGICCRGESSPMILGNVLHANTANDDGGGIHVYSGAPTISGNTVSDNTAEDGGGISCRNSAVSAVTHNDIVRNTAEHDGGGLYCYSASPSVRNNTLRANEATSGGAVYLKSSSATLLNNTLSENHADYRAAGIYAEQSPATLVNNIIAFGSSGIYSEGSSPTLRNNCLYGNWTNDYLGVSAGTGDIASDPGFIDASAGDFHLTAASACLEAGDSSVVPSGASDLDGQARTNAVVDIGADEYHPFDVVYVKPDGDDGQDGSSWSNAMRTIQVALDAATAPGEVWVQAGTYSECVTLKAGVRLYGGFAGTETARDQRNATANTTTLDGQQAGSVVSAPAGCGVTTRIDGFTVRNGLAERGAGVLCIAASPSIANNLITANSASSAVSNDTFGAGIYCEGGSPSIVNNTIMANTASSDGEGASASGGGIYCIESSCKIAENTLYNNHALSTGGGIASLNSDSPKIIGNTLSGNDAEQGGAIHCSNSSPAIRNNRIVGNSAAVGGGIHCWLASPQIVNNALNGNSAATGGGAIYCANGSAPAIVNNTLMGNNAVNGGAIYSVDSSPTIVNNVVAFGSSGVYGTNSSMTFRNNCAYGNTDYNYSGIGDPTGTGGNIAVNPELASFEYGNGHIQTHSPCVDAGDTSVMTPGWTDVDGEARMQGAGIDIGADETSQSWTVSPAVIRVSPSGNDLNDGSSWPLAFRSVQAAVAEAAATGGEVWVKMGIYYEHVTFLPYAYVYGGFNGTETARTQRNPTLYTTILDGQGTGTVATVKAGYTFGTINGFTIRNAAASGIRCSSSSTTIAGNKIINNTSDAGGGIYCYYSSPVISNNTIEGNAATGDGGGIFCTNASPLLIANSLSVNDAVNGGAIAVFNSSPNIGGNTVAGNTASEAGGGVYCRDSSPTIALNEITGNAAADGGGVYCWSFSPTLVNNTIRGNTASAAGGGVCCDAGSTPLLLNNTILANTAADGGGVYASPSSSPTITNCILWENGDDLANCLATYSCIEDGDAGDGNIATDPALYADAHIQGRSPCIDAGTSIGAPTTDRDGEARPAGAGIDIGADEFGDTDLDGLADWWETDQGLNPNLADTDGDGHDDGDEVDAGTDPLDPADYPLSGLAVTAPAGTTTGTVGKALTVSWIGAWALDAANITLWQETNSWVLATNVTSAATNMSTSVQLPVSLEFDTNFFVRVSDSVQTNDFADSATFATRPMSPDDFDGDGKTDFWIYDPGSGRWFVEHSSNGTVRVDPFGWNGPTPVPEDYDGDGKFDLALFDQPTGNWYLLKSRDGFALIAFGWAATRPVPGDYDGDGKADLAVYHSASGTWYVRQSSNGQVNVRQFGWDGPTPVPADYDGDGVTDRAVYSGPNGTWYMLRSTLNFGVQPFGWDGPTPVPADYDGDGAADFGLYHQPTGDWFLLRSTAGFRTMQFGWAAAGPVPGDYDGDWKADMAVLAPGGWWYLMRSSAGFMAKQFGW
ncbi:MAG: right-handed parallel beta-helix repeat-containing protein [Kiritimatiellae bacterium]|nr:right-handed parallel beta-helix repeat-containing protein [Kiritimatiellia bacterium]